VICDRVLGDVHISSHHLVPKSKGGTYGETILIHHICHQKIHSVFTEAELKVQLYTVAALREHEEMQKFIKWVSKQHPSFYQKNKKANRK
jgi:hypothetical protein